MRMPGTVRHDLRADIEACGYFPDLVEDAVVSALADEPVVDFVVHHEPTFDRDEIHRHLTVLLLTPTRLLIGHTDDHPADETMPSGTFATTSTESVPLAKVNSVVLTRVVSSPERYRPGTDGVYETWLTVGWGAVRRIDLEPASCSDPQCEADHGYTGTQVGDDLSVRMSHAADGERRVERLIRFSHALQRAAAV